MNATGVVGPNVQIVVLTQLRIDLFCRHALVHEEPEPPRCPTPMENPSEPDVLVILHYDLELLVAVTRLHQ